MTLPKVAAALIALAGAVVAVAVLVKSPGDHRAVESLPPATAVTVATTESVAPSSPVSEVSQLPATNAAPTLQPVITVAREEQPAPATNKLERLAQIRETFRALAAGDKSTALRAAKQIVDENERETAMLTLVTEWTQGELSSPSLRAERIANFGLEAALGAELAKHPEVAMLWANELTDGPGRGLVLQVVARSLVNSVPAAAFALTQQIPEADRRKFSQALFADWAGKDTAAALQWAEQLPDLVEREQALQSIRSVAPVGIGTALAIEGGYPIITGLVQGTPAQLSGQLQAGDRIVALAQGSGGFVDVYQVPLEEVVKNIRGLPNTVLQLKVLPAGAAPNTPPRTVVILRDQIKFKR